MHRRLTQGEKAGQWVYVCMGQSEKPLLLPKDRSEEIWGQAVHTPWDLWFLMTRACLTYRNPKKTNFLVSEVCPPHQTMKIASFFLPMLSLFSLFILYLLPAKRQGVGVSLALLSAPFLLCIWLECQCAGPLLWFLGPSGFLYPAWLNRNGTSFPQLNFQIGRASCRERV